MQPFQQVHGYHHALSEGEGGTRILEAAVSDHSDVRAALGFLRRHALLIAFVTVATAAAAFGISITQPNSYTGNATLLWTPTPSASGNLPDTASTMQTIQGIAGSSTVLSPIASAYHLSLRQLKRDTSAGISISQTSASQILTISAKASSPGVAASIANALSTALINYRASRQKRVLSAQITFLQQQLDTLAGKTDPSSVAAASDVRTQLVQLRSEQAVFAPDLSVLTPAVPPTSASSPRPKRNAAMGLFVGLVLGLLLGAFRDRLDRRTHSADEVEAIYGAPTLGRVPFGGTRRTSRGELLADFAAASPLADAYRTIRTNLSLYQLKQGKSIVVLVTSAVPAEGKSAVSANLAHSLSVTGKRVLAVSADLHNPSLHEYFGSPADDSGVAPIMLVNESARGRLSAPRPASGLIQVLAGEVSLDEGARLIPLTPRERASGGSLSLLANSSTFFDPAALFGSGQMEQFLEEARERFDVIVLDSPPLHANADAALLAQVSDVVVVVARIKHLTRNQARRAARMMAAAHISPTGLIVTGDQDGEDYGYSYRYGYDQQVAVGPAKGDPEPSKHRASNTASF